MADPYRIGLDLGAQPGIQTQDPYESSLLSELEAARQRQAKLTRPKEAPRQFITIRGNQVGMQTPFFPQAQQNDWDNSVNSLGVAQQALTGYRNQRYGTDLQKRAGEADIEKTQAQTQQAKSQSDIFSDPDKLAAYMAAQGVPDATIKNLQMERERRNAPPRAPGQPISGRDLPQVLQQRGNEFLAPYFNKSDPGYNANVSLTAPEIYSQVASMAGPELQDTKSPLANAFMSGMQQRFPGPEGFGSFARQAPNRLGQSIVGPLMSVLTGGLAKTWDLQKSHDQGNQFQSYLQRYNDAIKNIGVQGPPAPVPAIQNAPVQPQASVTEPIGSLASFQDLMKRVR